MQESHGRQGATARNEDDPNHLGDKKVAEKKETENCTQEEQHARKDDEPENALKRQISHNKVGKHQQNEEDQNDLSDHQVAARENCTTNEKDANRDDEQEEENELGSWMIVVAAFIFCFTQVNSFQQIIASVSIYLQGVH